MSDEPPSLRMIMEVIGGIGAIIAVAIGIVGLLPPSDLRGFLLGVWLTFCLAAISYWFLRRREKPTEILRPKAGGDKKLEHKQKLIESYIEYRKERGVTGDVRNALFLKHFPLRKAILEHLKSGYSESDIYDIFEEWDKLERPEDDERMSELEKEFDPRMEILIGEARVGYLKGKCYLCSKP